MYHSRLSFFIFLSVITMTTQTMNKVVKQPRSLDFSSFAPIDQDSLLQELTQETQAVFAQGIDIDRQIAECQEKEDEAMATLAGFKQEFKSLNGLEEKKDFVQRFVAFRNQLEQPSFVYNETKKLERNMIRETWQAITQRRQAEKLQKKEVKSNISHKNKSPLFFISKK